MKKPTDSLRSTCSIMSIACSEFSGLTLKNRLKSMPIDSVSFCGYLFSASMKQTESLFGFLHLQVGVRQSPQRLW